MQKERTYRCSICRERFPAREIQVKMPYVCKGCIPEYFKRNKEKVIRQAKTKARKEERARLNKIREELMTLSDWMKIAQRHFNAYIRKRDEGLNCIACNKPIRGTPHASHYLSVGGFPELRFNELNVHSGCNSCNTYRNGNLIEYTENLPKRIGQENYDYLMSLRNIPRQYTIPEIKDLIEEYKEKLKELKKV